MEISAKELAALAGGFVDGDGDVMVSGFAKIEDAGPGTVTFLANPKYTHYIYETHASAVLVSKDFVAEKPLTCTLIRVSDPYATLAELLSQIESSKSVPTGIEEPVKIADDAVVGKDVYVGAFSWIGRNVRIADGVKIYPQCFIGDGVEIGEGSIIRAGVRIYEGCRIGSRCVIHSGAVIGADGFGFAPTKDGYEKIPQTGNVVIADDVEIGANTTIDRATFGSTCIGKGTKIDNLVQVAHNVTIGERNVFAAQTGVAGSTKIGNCNMVGGQTGFAGHITVGDMNEIGAQSGIPNNVGSRKRIIGYPAIDARQFAKNAVYIRRLEQLFDDVKQLIKQQ